MSRVRTPYDWIFNDTLCRIIADLIPDIVPVIMAGIIGIYGLVVSVLISDGLRQDLPLYTGFIQLGAGLSVGLAGLAAGYVNPKILFSTSDSRCSFTPSLTMEKLTSF